jgi:hypothetical protein
VIQVPNWDEIEYNQISADWRHRDNLTWQIPSVIVAVGGALVTAAFGLKIDHEWLYTIRLILLAFGASFSLTLSIALGQNLRYQVASESALEKLLSGKGKEITRAEGKVRRTLSPRDMGLSGCDVVRRLVAGLTGSFCLLVLSWLVTFVLIALLVSVI